MPFAARRMFDENGIELFSLEKVERMSLIYVTSGEPWIDPGTLTGTDLHYAARLASDVRAIEHFVTLRECHGMCLEVEGEVLKEGALVRVGKCGLSHMDRAELTRTPTPPPPPPKLETEEERLAKKTPHFRTHYYFEMGLDTREWMNQSKNSRSYVLTPQEIPKPPPPVVIEPQSYDPNYYKQSFVFENGFVICKFDRKLALSVNQFGRACLAKLDVTDPSQQWHVNSQGNLYPGSKVDHVLTVSMPIVMPGQELCDAVSELYCGNEVQLQPVCKHKFGAANQKWSLDPKLGIIDAFATSQLDCDVTVANRSGVCTNALSDGVALDQIGYTMTHHNSKFYLCVSCARVIRGSGQTMDKIRDPITFCCDIQPGNPISKVYRGSFKALSKKLDLSTSRASDTLYRLREKLNRIQNQKVAIADKPFSFYEPALLISVLAWKNGEPKSEQEPALVSGSSIEQILSAANSKLGFPASGACAEYVFTPEGELITTTEQLVHCSLNKYSQDQAEKSGSATFRKSNRENTFSKLDDDEISNDSPSTDITLRPSTAAHGKRGSSHNDTFENGKETSPSVESPLTRPGAPEPLVNLFKNANFRDREEKNDDVPSCWNAVNGAELICNFDDDLETTVCRVERTKPSSSISQDLSDVLSLSCRYKVSLKVFLEDLENRVFKCTIVFKRTRKSRAEVLPVISAEVNSGNWVDMRGAVNMPRSAESDLFQCNMLFAVEGGEGSFSVAELELKDDVSTIKSPDINLFENGELDSKNGPHQPVYWLPGNPSSKLVVPKPGTCEVTSINRQSDATPMSDGDDNSSQKDEKQSNFSCFYDVTHIISKENLYKLEVDFRALTAPGTDVVTLLSHKVSGQKEKTIELSKNEVHENSWCNVSCNLSLPHVSADELIEYCAIRFEAKNSFVFRKPAFYCCTAPMTSKSPPKSADGVISDEEDVPLDGQLLGKNNETHMLSNYGASMDRTELGRILVNHPLEVYVSSTSKFIDPKFVMEKFHQEKEMFNRRRLTGVHMDIEKHKLRLLKGRRIGKCSGARLEPTENPTQPVVVTGSWMDVSREEIRLEQKVQKLKKTYDTHNAREPSKLTNGDYAKPLRPQGKPVLVYKNGEDASVATNIVSVWANSLDDILVIATNRLKMGFAARKLYRSNGEVVASFDEIVKHELLCASQGENFVKHEDAKRKCFLKSRWARDKRLGRERPPDVVIKPRINPLAKVDPLRDAWYSKTASRVDANESQLTQSSITFLTQLPVS